MTERRGCAIIPLVDASVAHLVERHLAKVEVASSSLVTRSRISPCSKRTRTYFYCWRLSGSNWLPPPNPWCNHGFSNPGGGGSPEKRSFSGVRLASSSLVTRCLATPSLNGCGPEKLRHNLLFHAVGGIPRGGRLLGCSRGLCFDGSAFPGRRFTLGHFVPRLRLGLVVGRLVSLGWAAPGGLSRILRFICLLALIRGRSLFRGLVLFASPSRAAVKSTTFPAGAGSPMPGIVVCFSFLPSGEPSLEPPYPLELAVPP